MITENNDTSSEIAALKNQIFTLLIALIVVSGTLTVYLFRQTSLSGKDLTQGRQLESVLMQNQASINTFVGQLVAYSQKHPDLKPVLAKYGITGAAPAPSGQ